MLLSWACGLYTVCTKHDPHFMASNPSRALVGSLALVLDMVQESSKAKPSLKKGAVVRVRRAFRSAGKLVPNVIATLLSIAKAHPTPGRIIELLGVAVSVLIRLKNVQDEPSSRLSQEYKVCVCRRFSRLDSNTVQEGIISLHGSVILMAKARCQSTHWCVVFRGPYRMY